MRVAVNGRFYGARTTGVQRVAREIAMRLSSYADTFVFVPRSVDPEALPDASPVLRGTTNGHVWEQLEFPWRARALGCDVALHLANSAPLWGGPQVVVLYDVTPLTHPEWYSRRFVWWWRAVVAPAVRRAERVLTVSHWTRGEIARTLGVPLEEIVVVQQGTAPFDRPADPNLVAQVLERHRLAPGYVLALGGATPRKNVGFLVELFDTWSRDGGEPPQLVVVGEGYPRVHRAVPHRALQDSAMAVRWLGHVSDAELHALYTAAAVFCFPSLAEGFGRPPLEAMGCGTPVVLAPYGAAAEAVGDAAVVLPLEQGAWIAALRELQSNERRRNDLVQRGSARVRRFKWDTATGVVHEALCAACGAGR